MLADRGWDGQVDSAAIGAWHVGAPPDPRSVQIGAERGYDLASIRGRQIKPADLDRFNHVIGLDSYHLRELQTMAQGHELAQISRLLDWAPQSGEIDVPDPYYGETEDFIRALDLVEIGMTALLDRVFAHTRQV